MENKSLHFDTQDETAIAHGRLPYTVSFPEKNIRLTVSLRVAGDYTYRVIDEERYREAMAMENAEKKMTTLFSVGLQAALTEMSEDLGLPENLPKNAETIAKAMEDRYLHAWHHSFGVSLEALAITLAEPEEKDAALLSSIKEALDFSRRMAEDPDAVMKEMAQKLKESADAFKAAWDKLTPEEQEAANRAAEEKMRKMQEERDKILAASRKFLTENRPLSENVTENRPPSEKLTEARPLSQNAYRTPTWTCGCGSVNSGNFCPRCGAKREWTCECGTVNAGNFCTQCGKGRK